MEINTFLGEAEMHLVRKTFHSMKKDAFTTSFPKSCRLGSMVETRGQGEYHTCGLEVSLLALLLGNIPIKDTEEGKVAKAINLNKSGTDPVDLYNGLSSLGLECRMLNGFSARALRSSLLNNSGKVVYIWLGQQAAYARKVGEVISGAVGHYMLAVHADSDYIYFADPGYKGGKCRYKWTMLDPFWYDFNARNFYRGFAIEVPVKVFTNSRFAPV